MMHHSTRNESGFALATAILALVVVGALVTAGFFASSQEARVGTSNSQADIAFYVAEQGLQNAVGTVTRGTMRNVGVGSELTRTGTVAIGTRNVGNYTVTVRPFGNNLYWAESLGTVTEGGRYAGAQRRVGMVLRTLNFGVPMNGAVTTFGGITLNGNADVSGVDTNPADWNPADCGPNIPAEAGIYTNPDAPVNLIGSVNVIGSPAVEYANIPTSTFTDFGEIDFDDFAALATWILPTSLSPNPALTGTGHCNVALMSNWGEPLSRTHPCYNHFPLLYAPNGLSVSGNGRGQGILVVNGDLGISGGFEFYGIVIVSGVFNNGTGSGNAQVHGTLLVGSNAQITDVSSYRGTPQIQFSTCAVERAILNNSSLSRLLPVQQRSWVDLTAAGVTD